MNQELQIRSSAAEFLIFQTQEQGNGIQVYYKNETVWLSQKAIVKCRESVEKPFDL